jgi:Rhs element Vgr protein
MRPIKCQFQIKGNDIQAKIGSLDLIQEINGHHYFTLLLKEMPESGGKESLKAISPGDYTGFLGEPIRFILEALDKSYTFDGVITNIRFSNTVGDVNQIILTGSSPTLLMDLSKKNSFFHEKSFNEIAKVILKDYSIKSECNGSAEAPRPFCYQYMETDYHLISRLAHEEGIWTYYDGEKFRITSQMSEEFLRLKWRETLLEFDLGLRIRPLFCQTDIYNYMEKKTFHQTTKNLRTGMSLPELTQFTSDVSEKLHQGHAYLKGSDEVVDQKELDTRLQHWKSSEIGQLVVGKGRADIPGLVPGRFVEVVGMENFDGQYLLTKVSHSCNETGQYECTFECVPSAAAHPHSTHSRTPLDEVQSAVVTDTNDPEKLGRVKVRFHWNEDGDKTPWIRVASTSAGGGRGLYCIPEIGDEVLVAFRNNDPDLPVVFGSLYTGKDKPRADLHDENNNQKALLTKGGNTILLRDKEGEEEILINTKDMKNQISLKMGTPPSIIIKSEGNLVVESKTITIKAEEDFSCIAGGTAKIKSEKPLKIEGEKTEIKGKGGVKVEGSKIELN